MVYLLNLSKDDYLSGTIPNKTEIQSEITMDGKFAANMIPYSIEYEKTIQGSKDPKSQIQAIIKAGYE